MDIMEYMYLRGVRWIGKDYDGSLTAFGIKPIMDEGKWKTEEYNDVAKSVDILDALFDQLEPGNLINIERTIQSSINWSNKFGRIIICE
ncbi:hypothetical protein [Veillonella sp.]|uniref:hypothetical protein n=1 Tax=Veillonella sp. TaxID=1926307 RepID=UPI0025F69918|nr:hypothetical protein [Veillonella sp.]